MLLDDIKTVCAEAIRSAFDTDIAPQDLSLDFPDRFGDIALNCFYLAKTLRKAPPMIATEVAAALQGAELFEAAEPVSGYVNFTVDRSRLFEGALSPAVSSTDTWGHVDGEAKRIMIEFSSPNTNKPQHLGHVRNNCLGESISRLREATGTTVIRANVVNDRGIHICKSMLAYARLGDGATPESAGKKGDHYVGDWYVAFESNLTREWEEYKTANPGEADISKEDFFKRSDWGRGAQELLKKWEEGDEETVALWKTMNGWVMDGFKETYDTLGISFDRIYLESETYLLGKDNIERGLELGIFYERDDGAIEADLTDEKLDKKVVLRSDGTSVYITQDLGATPMKAEEFDLDGQIFVVGNEQIYHFKVLFSLLRKLGYPWAENLVHLAYGMVNLPHGKMKSREGTVVDADDLIDEVTDLSLAIIKENDADIDIEAPDVRARARRIGLGALKFFILNVSPTTTMTFNPEESVKFDGATGPYVMYAFARIRRMIEDSGLDESAVTFDASKLGDETEVKLALQVLQFPTVVERASRDLNPAHVSAYLLGLARAYHSHNTAVRILKAEDPEVRQARLALSLATAHTLKRGLALLGIDTVDQM